MCFFQKKPYPKPHPEHWQGVVELWCRITACQGSWNDRSPEVGPTTITSEGGKEQRIGQGGGGWDKGSKMRILKSKIALKTKTKRRKRRSPHFPTRPFAGDKAVTSKKGALIWCVNGHQWWASPPSSPMRIPLLFTLHLQASKSFGGLIWNSVIQRERESQWGMMNWWMSGEELEVKMAVTRGPLVMLMLQLYSDGDGTLYERLSAHCAPPLNFSLVSFI